MLEQAVEIKMGVDIKFYDLNLGTLSTRVTTIGLLPILLPGKGGTQWRSWLRQSATSRKVPGSIPNGVIVNFH
jgi:hypothetical protein